MQSLTDRMGIFANVGSAGDRGILQIDSKTKEAGFGGIFKDRHVFRRLGLSPTGRRNNMTTRTELLHALSRTFDLTGERYVRNGCFTEEFLDVLEEKLNRPGEPKVFDKSKFLMDETGRVKCGLPLTGRRIFQIRSAVQAAQSGLEPKSAEEVARVRGIRDLFLRKLEAHAGKVGQLDGEAFRLEDAATPEQTQYIAKRAEQMLRDGVRASTKGTFIQNCNQIELDLHRDYEMLVNGELRGYKSDYQGVSQDGCKQADRRLEQELLVAFGRENLGVAKLFSTFAHQACLAPAYFSVNEMRMGLPDAPPCHCRLLVPQTTAGESDGTDPYRMSLFELEKTGAGTFRLTLDYVSRPNSDSVPCAESSPLLDSRKSHVAYHAEIEFGHASADDPDGFEITWDDMRIGDETDVDQPKQPQTERYFIRVDPERTMLASTAVSGVIG